MVGLGLAWLPHQDESSKLPHQETPLYLINTNLPNYPHQYKSSKLPSSAQIFQTTLISTNLRNYLIKRHPSTSIINTNLPNYHIKRHPSTLIILIFQTTSLIQLFQTTLSRDTPLLSSTQIFQTTSSRDTPLLLD